MRPDVEPMLHLIVLNNMLCILLVSPFITFSFNFTSFLELMDNNKKKSSAIFQILLSCMTILKYTILSIAF